MELGIVSKTLGFAHKRKKLIYTIALLGLSSYGVYKVYNLPYVSRKRKRMVKLLGALVSIAEMVSDSAETVGFVSRDLKEFLQSDSDQIPNSLKQISKIATSDEFSESLCRVSEAVTVGILRGYKRTSRNEIGLRVESGNSAFTDKVMDRLFSTAGTGFASVVVGSFARNLVLGLISNSSAVSFESSGNAMVLSNCASGTSDTPEWVNVICSDKCRDLIGDCIQKFVSTAVAVYLDKTMGINAYDEIFTGLTNPNHQNKMKDMLVTVCNSAIETLVKTSHQVLTTPEPASKSSCSIVDPVEVHKMSADSHFEHDVPFKSMTKKSSFDNNQRIEWLDRFLSTVTVPNNRKFMLDVTSRVTVGTVRSFMAFVLWHISSNMKRSASLVRKEFVNTGLEVIRYIGEKSSVIVTICLALYLHVVGTTGVLLPA